MFLEAVAGSATQFRRPRESFARPSLSGGVFALELFRCNLVMGSILYRAEHRMPAPLRLWL